VGGLEESSVGPSHDEVTMKTVSSGITVGKSEAVEVGVRAGIEEELIEQGEDGDGVGLGAHTTVVVSDSRVGHMAHVVRGINVDTVPARGEVHLRPHEIASPGREPWVLHGPSVVHAHDRDGTLSGIRVVLVTTVRVTSNHPKPIGERQGDEALVARRGGGGVVACSLLVVVRGALEGDQFEHVVRVVVQVGDPVVAVVQGLVAGGVGGALGEHGAIHGPVEGIATNNAVSVSACYSRVEDWVGPLDGQHSTVHCKSVTIKCSSKGDEGTQHTQEESSLHD